MISPDRPNPQVIKDFKEERERIISESRNENPGFEENHLVDEYDSIDDREFEKFYRFSVRESEEEKGSDEQEYAYKVRFYLDSEVNFYEKDR